MKVPFARPMIGKEERDAVAEVMRHHEMTNAGTVRGFEERFQETVGGGRAVAVSSGMAALHLAFLSAKDKSRTDVIMPALNHRAMAHAAVLAGLRCVFVDVLPKTGNVDPAAVEQALTQSTGIIGLVHLLGVSCDMGAIMDIARRHSIAVIEDCALALGGLYDERHLGLIGDAGCFSFYPAKHITTGEGGMLLTKHGRVTAGAEEWRAFAYGMDGGVGFNYRMTEMQAALGVEQLARLPGFLEARTRNFDTLAGEIKEIGLEMFGGGAHFALSVMLPETVSRETIRTALLDEQIETSVYYSPIVPLLSYYAKKYGYQPGQFPVAERIAAQSLTFSVGPHLTPAHMCYQAAALGRQISDHEPA